MDDFDAENVSVYTIYACSLHKALLIIITHVFLL